MIESLNVDKRLIRENDTLGREEAAKLTFDTLLKLFKENAGQETIANLLGIESQSLRGYRRTGRVSLYSTMGLSKIFGIERDYFNGKKTLTQEIINKIQSVLRKIDEECKLHSPEVITEEEVNQDLYNKGLFAKMLLDKCSIVSSYEEYSLEEMEEIIGLLDKNLRIARAKAEILRITNETNSAKRF